MDLGLLESDDRDQWQRIDEIFDYLQIADRSVVADVAAGGGWFAERIARRVGPAGIVYAEEIQALMIQAIGHRMQTEQLTNVVPVLGLPTDPRLPKGALDAVTIVNAFRDIDTPIPLLKNLRDSLNNRGLLGVVDFRPGGGGPGPDTDDRVAPELIIASAEAAGLRLVARHPIPPFEFLLVFGK
jgi:predicted methyltransferase